MTLPLGPANTLSYGGISFFFSCTRNIQDFTSKTKHIAITIYVSDYIVIVYDAFLIYYLTAVNSDLLFEIAGNRCTKLLNKK